MTTLPSGGDLPPQHLHDPLPRPEARVEPRARQPERERQHGLRHGHHVALQPPLGVARQRGHEHVADGVEGHLERGVQHDDGGGGGRGEAGGQRQPVPHEAAGEGVEGGGEGGGGPGVEEGRDGAAQGAVRGVVGAEEAVLAEEVGDGAHVPLGEACGLGGEERSGSGVRGDEDVGGAEERRAEAGRAVPAVALGDEVVEAPAAAVGGHEGQRLHGAPPPAAPPPRRRRRLCTNVAVLMMTMLVRIVSSFEFEESGDDDGDAEAVGRGRGG